MSFLFLIFAAAILSIFFKRRRLAIALVLGGIVLSAAMLWHHATDVLKINW